MLMSGTLFKIFKHWYEQIYVLDRHTRVYLPSWRSPLSVILPSVGHFRLYPGPTVHVCLVYLVSAGFWLCSSPYPIFSSQRKLILYLRQKPNGVMRACRVEKQERKKERKPVLVDALGPPPPVLVAAPVPLAALLGPESLFF